MKILAQILAYFGILAVIYFAILNSHDVVTLQVWGPKLISGTQEVYHYTKDVNIAFYTIAILVIGLAVGVGMFSPFYFAMEEKLKIYKRELESNSVKSDSSSSQVKVLEAQVQVLEKSVSDALNR